MKHIYLLSSERYQKLGIATSVQGRLNDLQTGNPFVIKLLAYWPTQTPRHTEKILHSYYSVWRIRGEWFKIPYKELEQLVLVRGIDIWADQVLLPRIKVRIDLANSLLSER